MTSMDSLRDTHAGITWVKSMKSTTGSKNVLYFFMTNKIEKNKFKNKMSEGLMTGKSHRTNPQYENNWYQGTIILSMNNIK